MNSISLWKSDGGVLKIDSDLAGASIARDVGLQAVVNRTKAKMDVVADAPAKFDAWKLEYEAACKKIGAEFATDFEVFHKAGYPEEQAKFMAEKRAAADLKFELSKLDIKYPGVLDEDFMVSASAQTPGAAEYYLSRRAGKGNHQPHSGFQKQKRKAKGKAKK